MKNLIFTTITAIVLCMTALFTQAQTTLFLSSPDTLRACDVNRFSVSIVNPVTDTIIITPQLNFPNGTSASCTTSGSGVNYIFESVSGGSATTLQTGNVLRFVLNGTGTVTYTYRAEIDCHVIMIDSSAGLVKLQQDFTGSNSYIINPGSSNSIEQAVNYTKITELNAGNNFYVNYQQDTTWLFYYKNTLSHRANIGFTFNVNTGTACNDLVFGAVEYGIGLQGQTVAYSGSPSQDTVMLNASDTLVIRIKVKATNCVSCSSMNAAFSYRCNQSLSGCSTCEHSFVHAYTANMNDKPKIDVLRVSPQQVTYDNSCINDTTQTTQWSYTLVNTGNCAIDSVQFDLTQLGDAAWDVRRLMLMPRKSLVIEKTSLSHCTIDTILELRSQHLCADLVDTAVYSCYTMITDFYPGDTVHLQFALLRCSQDTSVLMNAYKYYNAWMFKGLKTRSICGVEQTVPTASGFAAGTLLAGQTGGGGYDVHLQHQFYPSVSDMSVSNSGIGEKATFNVRLQSILNNGKPYVYQLLGCNQPQQQCTTLNGWLRATVVCNTNLTIPNAYSDAFMITLSATGDTTFYKPYYYDITQDSLSCEAKRYHYYFNLADSGMRTVIDSGRFVYTLQACCKSDIDPTPYKAEFHLLADAGNCFTINLPTASVFHYQEPTFSATDGIAQWLPLSHAGNSISIHCPGCVIPGIIVDHYRMERNTYGLQDSDNDHCADSATAVIDTGSVWFAQNKNNLSSTTLAFGDRCTDYLRAHVQPGDPGNDGYTYAMMKALGLRLNALQLSRIMPLALDTMMVVPDTLTFYIDDPTDSIGGCLECEPFGAGADDYITLLKIRVTGTDIAQYFLKTNTALNEYLYNFTSFFDSTAVSDTGNLHITTLNVPIGSSRSFHGFEEGQSIRLKVSYHVCGNFNPAGDLTAENTFRQSHIQNTMWLSGKRQPHSQVPQMEQSLTLLQNSMNITIYDTLAPPYNLMDTGYVNNRLFFCETRGSFAYFAATTFRNKTIITNKNIFQCRKRMEINMSSGYCNNAQVYDAYPFEFRSPLIAGQSVNVNVPPGYEIIQATSKHKVPIGNNFFQTMPVDITTQLPNTTGNFSLNTTPFIATHCLTNDTTAQNLTTGTTAYMGDQFYEHTITLDMMPIACTDDTAHNNSSSTVVTFGNQAAPCQSFYGCQNTTTTMTNSSNAIEDFTLAPQLTSMGIGNSLATGISDTVCWNNLVLMNTTKDNADHVFLSVANAPAYLSQWHYISHPSGTITQANGDVIGLAPTLAQNILLSGSVCAVMDSCPPLQDTLQFYLYYGWNCKNFPATPFAIDSVCFTDSVPLKFTRAAYELVTASWSQTSSFSLCDTLFAEAKFQNGKAGFVYPFMVTLPGYDPRLQIIAAMACSNTDTVGLTPTAAPDVWTVTTDSLLALLGSTGIHNSQFVTIRFRMVSSCGFGLNATDALPDLQLTAVGFCNDTLIANSRLYGTEQPAFAWDSTSQCPDCWNIAKTASTDTVAVGDTLSYTITVCNNSVNTQTGTLADNIPANFVITNNTLPATVTLNSMQCDTFTVSGYFTSPGSCFYNVASVTSPANTTWKDSVCVTVINVCNVPNAQQIADSSFSLPMSASYSNASFVLHGRFYVNDTLTLINCSVYAYPGAQIIVLTGGTLILQGTSITGCTQMWKGIMLNNKSRLVMTEQSLVADADIGIQAMNGSSFFLLGSRVTDCVRSIYVPQQSNGLNNIQGYVNDCSFGLYAAAFKPDYAGQPPHHAMPRACMEFNDVVMTIGDYQYNEFRNCNWGIYAVRSMLKVQKGRFYNMNKGGSLYGSAAHKGSAIVAESKTAVKAGKIQVADCQIDTCEHGIYTEWTTADINNVNALHVTGNGSYHLYCNSANMSTYVGACNIEAGKSGIVFQNSEQATMTAKNNTIKVTAGGSSVGIKIIATNSNAGNYVLKGNVIEAANGNGITVNFAKNATIVDNMIKLSGNTTNGISLTGCDSSTVSCNTVIGRYPAVNYQNRGIYGSMNQKCYISCNVTDSLYKGVHFSSSNIATKFRGNEMKKHYIGLYLDNTAVIDTQSHAGNMWTGTYNSTYGAWNENAIPFFNLFKSLFIIDQTLGIVYNPNIPLGINPGEPNDQGWFQPDTSGHTFDCIGYLQCENISHDNSRGAVSLQEAIASDSVISSGYIDETKSMAQVFLFETLKNDTSAINGSTVLMQFVNDNASTNLGKLYQTKQLLNEVYYTDSSNFSLIKEKDSLITLHLNSILQMDSISAADSSINNINARQQEVDETVLLQQQKAVAITQSIKIQKADDAKVINNTIFNNRLPEENIKEVNEIKIMFDKYGVDSIATDYATLLNIAQQCPQSGGVAVYQARSLVALFGDTIFYNDENVCFQQGYYRIANETKSNKTEKEVDLKPNPANNYADVILNKSFEGICRIKITDMYSKIIFEQSFDCHEKQFRINTTDVLNGMYNVQITINDNTQAIVKLIIVK